MVVSKLERMWNIWKQYCSAPFNNSFLQVTVNAGINVMLEAQAQNFWIFIFNAHYRSQCANACVFGWALEQLNEMVNSGVSDERWRIDDAVAAECFSLHKYRTQNDVHRGINNGEWRKNALRYKRRI